MNPVVSVETFVREFTHGPEVTWVGPSPFAGGISLGFDDGSIMFSDVATGRSEGLRQQVSEAKEAINGIAAIGTSSLAVSTRSDVTFIQLDDPAKDTRVVFAGGAHGVISTQSGYFVAPLGMRGLLIVKPDASNDQEFNVITSTKNNLYFYRVVTLRDTAGTEFLVSANRGNGVGVRRFHGEQDGRSIHTMRFEGLDVVDVCSVSSGSLSAVAISSRGEVLWLKDASKRDEPLVMQLTGIEGQVYRVLATTQHLFVLSSKALYVWSYLVESVLVNQEFARQSSPHVRYLEAVDMSLLNDDSLMLVMGTNTIEGFKIDDIIRDSSSLSSISKLEDFTPRWVSEDVEQIQKVAA